MKMLLEKLPVNCRKEYGAKLQKLEAAKENAERVAACATAFSGCIAHEMRTPLAIILLYADLLGRSCKNIVASVDDHNDMVGNASVDLYENKKNIDVCTNVIKQTIKDTNYLIGNMLLRLKGMHGNGKVVDKTNFVNCSIAENINKLLAQYPFLDGERELINFVCDHQGDCSDCASDFHYVGDPVLTEHILFNLLKNSLRAIHNAGKGTITITLKPRVAAGAIATTTGGAVKAAAKIRASTKSSAERECTINQLIFRDTASGVNKEFLVKMFSQFSSQMTTDGGTGVGLAFCKTVMQSYGGDIICNSVDGEYTEFVLSFPCALLMPAQKKQ
jgi:signal transduction histidine kinase